MATLSATLAVLRRLRAERGVMLLLAVLVAVTSLVVAAGPRLFERVADAGLRDAVARATSAQRDLRFTAVDRVRVGGDDDALAFVAARGDDLADRLPATLAGLVGDRSFTIDSTRFRLTDPPIAPTLVTLRLQSDVASLIELEAGRPPGAAPLVTDPAQPPRFEIALSVGTAAELGVKVGDVVPAAVDPADGMLSTYFPRPTTPVEFVVTGVFRVPDPEDPAWFDDPAYARAAIGGTDDAPVIFATALLDAAAYGDLLALGLPQRYAWRYGVEADRLDAANLPAIERDLRQVETAYGGTGALQPGRPRYRTGLLDVMARYRVERATTETALGVAAIGPIAVALGALGLVAVIVVRRRREGLVLARGRGASAGQLLGAQLGEGLLVSVPAAIVGLLVAGALVPGRAPGIATVGVAGVAAAVTALLVAATWPLARRARRLLDREPAASGAPAIRRLVVEATFVGGAVAGAWLLRERGLGAARPAGGDAAFDPFLAAAPVLVGLAVGLLTLRLYPLPVRAIAALAARRGDLVPVLGLRRTARDPGAAVLPLIVLSVTVAIGVFSSLVATTIERGQVEASWQEVGADYRVDAAPGGRLDGGLDPAAAPGVEAVAAALVGPTSSVAGEGGRRGSVTFVAIEPAAYEAVLAGTPVAPDLADLRLPADAGTDPAIGTDERPIPVLIARRLPIDWAPLTVGEVFRIGAFGRALSLEVVGLRDGFPAVRPDLGFIVAPLDAVRGALGRGDPRPTALFVRADAAAAADLRVALDVPSAPSVVSRHEGLAARRGAPLVAAVGQGFAVAVGAAAVYAVLAVVASIVLGANRRARELAHLRTLGLTDRQAIALVWVEQGPPAALALLIGTALGLGVAWLLQPGLGLSAYIGPTTTVRLQVDWAAIGAIAVVVLVVVGGLVGLSAWSARRLEPAMVMRMGDR